MGHSILQQDMPDEEDYYCEPTKRRKRRYSPSDVNTGNRSVHYHGRVALALPPHSLVASCAAQVCMDVVVLSVPWRAVPQLLQLAGRQDAARPGQHGDRPLPPLVCPCHRHVIDAHGDQIHACKKHTGSTKDAHETILDALQKICHDLHVHTAPQHIPSVCKPNGKTGRGDLVIKTPTLVAIGM